MEGLFKSCGTTVDWCIAWQYWARGLFQLPQGCATDLLTHDCKQAEQPKGQLNTLYTYPIQTQKVFRPPAPLKIELIERSFKKMDC